MKYLSFDAQYAGESDLPLVYQFLAGLLAEELYNTYRYSAFIVLTSAERNEEENTGPISRPPGET